MPEWMKKRLAGTSDSPGEIDIAPDEVDALNLFLSLQTQWHCHAMTGTRLGLIYDAIEPTSRMAGIGAVSPLLFGDLQAMEAAALSAFAEMQAPR